MSWAKALCLLYDINVERAGKVENWNGAPLVLLPIGFDTMKAQIEITIDIDGNFDSARVLDESESWTFVPYPERRTRNVKALPLCDSLTYVAGDFLDYVMDSEAQKIQNCFAQYIEGLRKWTESKYTHPAVVAIYKYVLKKTVMNDLFNRNVLPKPNDRCLTVNDKVQGASIDKAFVRFRVLDDSKESAVWLNLDVQKRFTQFYISSLNQDGLCYFTGEKQAIAKTNPVKLRGEWDTKASLISSNDKTNFTYRGRFLTKNETTGINEAMSVGYEISQKIHNALKWIIRRQGYSHDGLCIVTWENYLKDMPAFYDSVLELTGAKADKIEDTSNDAVALFGEQKPENADTNYAGARDVNLAIDGYAKKLSADSRMRILALDSATPGRVAITYYKDMVTSTYLKNIRAWQESCCWRHKYKIKGKDKKEKVLQYEGMASIREVAQALYGTEQMGYLKLRINDGGKCPMLTSTFERIRPCIIDQAAIPCDIVQRSVQKASNPMAYETRFNYCRVLHIACSLVKKYFWDKGEKFKMELDEKCTNRSYLFGRLLAVAERIERCTFDKGEPRATNAERYMRQFSRTPMRTWEIIRRNIQVYLNQLKPGSREYYKKLFSTICELFDKGEYETRSALDGRFLLGYDCQREALRYKKNDESNTLVNEDESNNTNEEDE